MVAAFICCARFWVAILAYVLGLLESEVCEKTFIFIATIVVAWLRAGKLVGLLPAISNCIFGKTQAIIVFRI